MDISTFIQIAIAKADLFICNIGYYLPYILISIMAGVWAWWVVFHRAHTYSESDDDK